MVELETRMIFVSSVEDVLQTCSSVIKNNER